MIDYMESVSGYKERLERITLFDIFTQSNNKKKKDQLGNNIDFYGVMLLTLLFFFECMLTRVKTSGVSELSIYLKGLIGNQYVLNDQEYMDIAKSMIEILRPTGGKRKRKTFINFETGEEDFIEVSYLKVDGWNKEKNHQYYSLDEQGLELVFATKEYYNEFQISISQLIIRKQLEKGEFVGAIRQIDEMRISVHSIRDKIINIKHEIVSNIVSDEVYKRYRQLIEDINSRLIREHEEFQELTGFVKETKKHYERDMNHSEKDLKAYQSILRIDNELNDVHYLHSKLLDESIELKTKVLEAAREAMYFVGLTSFNFKKEILGNIVNTPMPFMETKLMAKPFLSLARKKVWSPVALFAKQRIMKNDYEVKLNEFLKYDSKKDQKELEVRKKVYRLIFEKVLKVMGADKEITLSKLIGNIDEEFRNKIELYEMLILMHQFSPIYVDDVKVKSEHIFSDAMKLIEGDKLMLVVEEIGEMKIHSGDIEISDMQISLVNKNINK